MSNWERLLDANRRNWAGVDGLMSDVYTASKQRERSALRSIAHRGIAQEVAAVLEPMAEQAAEQLAELEGRHGDLAAEQAVVKDQIDSLGTDRRHAAEHRERERERTRLIAQGKELSGRLAKLYAVLPDARTRADGMNRALAELRAIPLPPPDVFPGLREWLNQEPG